MFAVLLLVAALRTPVHIAGQTSREALVQQVPGDPP
jgi:hypothetical protein